MVRQLMTLKILMQWNSVKKNTWMVVIAIIASAHILPLISSLYAFSIFFNINGYSTQFAAIAVLGGSAITLGWLLGPIMTSGIDTSLDPRSLITYIPPSRTLAWALLLATGVGITGLVTTLVAFILPFGLFVGQQFLAASLAVVLLPLALLTAWTWSRLLTTFLDVIIDQKPHLKDTFTILGSLLFLALLAPLGVWIQFISHSVSNNIVMGLASVLAWTPFGAAWAVPFSVLNGSYVAAGAQALIALVFLCAGVWLWHRLLPYAMSGSRQPVPALADEALAQGRFLVDPTLSHAHSCDLSEVGRGRSSVQSRASRPQTAPRFLAGVDLWLILGLPTAAASLAARTLRDWVKDPRLSTSLSSALIFPFMAAFFATRIDDTVGVGFNALFYVFLILPAVTLGATVGALPSYDSTAFWVLCASGIRGRDERLGRLAGSIVVHVPILLATTVLAGLFVGLDGMLVVALALFVCVLYVGSAALTLILSAWRVYPVQPPEASPLSTKGTGSFALTMLLQLGGQFGAGMVALPAVVVFVLAWNGVLPLWVSMVVSIAWSVLVCVLTPLVSGRVWDRHHVQVLAQIRSWPGH